MTSRCVECDETYDLADNCACDRARELPVRVDQLEERIASLTERVEELERFMRNVLDKEEYQR